MIWRIFNVLCHPNAPVWQTSTSLGCKRSQSQNVCPSWSLFSPSTWDNAGPTVGARDCLMNWWWNHLLTVPFLLTHTSKRSLSFMIFMHSFIQYIFPRVLTMGLQWVSPTCPLCFLPTRPSPLPWENYHEPSTSDPSPASPTASHTHLPAMILIMSQAATEKLGWVPTVCQTWTPLLFSWLSCLSDRLIFKGTPNISHCNQTRS